MAKMCETQKLFEYFSNKHCSKCSPLQGMPCHECFVMDLAYQLEGMEVDADPVVYGHWIKATGMMPPEYFGKHVCSECDSFAPNRFNSMQEWLSNICPHCGAKMDGKDCDNNGKAD